MATTERQLQFKITDVIRNPDLSGRHERTRHISCMKYPFKISGRVSKTTKLVNIFLEILRVTFESVVEHVKYDLDIASCPVDVLNVPNGKLALGFTI